MTIKELNLYRYPNGLDDLREKRLYCSCCKNFLSKYSFYFCPSLNKSVSAYCKECSKKYGSKRRSKINYERIDDNVLVECNRCKEVKKAKEFSTKRARKTGIEPSCKSCIKEKYWLNRER